MAAIKYHQSIESLLMSRSIIDQFVHSIKLLLQFTPNLSEHIHGHVLNLLACLFFMTQHDSSLAIQIIQRLLNTFQYYQEQSISE